MVTLKISEIRNGNMNKIYLLDTDKDKFIIRTSDFNNHFECSALELLKQYNFKCPKIITHFELDNKFIMLYKYLEGDNPKEFNKRFFELLAKLLKRLHSIPQNFTKEDYSSNEESQSKLKEYYDKAIKTKYIKEDQEFIRGIYEEVSSLDLDSLDKSLIHSDIKKENMIQDKDELYLIDFGNCYVGSRIIDIIRVIMWFFIKNNNYDYESMKLFIDTYFDNNKITDKEKNATDKLLIYCILYNLLKDVSLNKDHILTDEYIENNSLNWLVALKEKEKMKKIGSLIKNA